MRHLLFITALFMSCVCSAQVRIDWQQSYGSLENDYSYSITETENGFLVFGMVDIDIPSGMFGCNAFIRAEWLIEIDHEQELIRQDCFPVGVYPKMLKSANGRYYVVELGDIYNLYNLRINQLDEESNVLWSRSFGTSYGLANTANNLFAVPTSDGGVVAATEFMTADGDISQEFGAKDCWVVKIDDQGNLAWETTLGTESNDFVFGLQNASDGGYYVGLVSVQQGNGNIGCGQPENNGVLVKLDASGQVQWSRCYPQIEICNVIDLESGFLLAGKHQKSDFTYDCCLLKCDSEGNVEWRKEYGGSGDDMVLKTFCQGKGGYTVFANSKSKDGDVVSAASLGMTDVEKGNIWVFHVDSDGSLLWERCIGSGLGLQESLQDVIEVGESEYVLLGESEWFEDASSGDVNCSNNAILPQSMNNIWVLHITDVFDYDALPEPNNGAIAIHPNPTTGKIHIEGEKATEIQVFNALGQLVKTVQNTNEVSLEGQPQGLYLLRVTLEGGKEFSDKVVKE